MKKSAIILSILSVSLVSLSAFAEDQGMDPNMDMGRQDGQSQGGPRGERGGMMGGKEMMMGKGMMGKGGMMGGMHQQSSMVATPDGGVIVLTGGKLTKYDTNLNVVKEVEVKGGPAPDKKDNMKWKEMPQGNSGPQPMDDKEISAMLDENPPADAPPASAEAPQGEAPPAGQ